MVFMNIVVNLNAFKCTLTSCTLISAVTGKHIYKKTIPITSLHFKGDLIFVRIIGYIFFNRPTRIYYSLLTKFRVKAIVKRQAVAYNCVGYKHSLKTDANYLGNIL